MKKTAIITGITGQDGSYLADLLLSKDYNVVGTLRRTVVSEKEKLANLSNINDNRLTLIDVDITDSASVYRMVKDRDWETTVLLRVPTTL